MAETLEIGAPVRVPLREQIACVAREIALRRGVYAKRVKAGVMRQAEADRETARMEAVLDTLREVEAGAADEPGEASGDD